jgi:amino acid permease
MSHSNDVPCELSGETNHDEPEPLPSAALTEASPGVSKAVVGHALVGTTSTEADERHPNDGLGKVPTPVRRGTITSTTVNIMCNVMGVGILSLPAAMCEASLIPGVFLLAIFGICALFSAYVIGVCCECLQLYSLDAHLAWCLCEPDAPNPDDDGGATEDGVTSSLRTSSPWAGAVSVAVDAAVASNNFACLIAYSRVVSDAIPQVLGDFFGCSGALLDRRLWLFVSAAVCTVFTSRRTFSELRLLSLVGVGTILFMVICIIIRFPSPPATVGTTQAARDEVRLVSVSSELLQAFGALSTAYAFHYNAPAFYQEMAERSPRRFGQSLLTSIAAVAVTYCATGVLGYLTFGSDVLSAAAGGDISNNYLPTDRLINLARLLLCAHFWSVFPVIAVNVRRCLHRLVLRAMGDAARANEPNEVFRTPRWAIIAEACAVVWASALIAAVVPGIGFVIRLSGSVTGCFIFMILPGIVGARVFGSHHALHASDLLCAPHILRRACQIMAALGVASTVSGVAAVLSNVA